MRSAPRKLLAPLVALFAAVLLFALFVVNGLMLYGIHASRGWMRHTRELQSAASAADAALVEADAGGRGFLLTGDESYLEPFHAAKETLARLFVEMQRLAADDPSQEARVVVLERIVDAKLAGIGRTIERYQGGHAPAALAVVRNPLSRKTMDEARLVITEIREHAEEQLERRTLRARQKLDLAIWIDVGAGIGLFALGAILFAIRRDIARREDLQRALTDALTFQEQFLGILGHDLRNPLSAVRVAAHLIAKGDNLTERQGRSVRAIESATLRMDRMVVQLLDFARARIAGGIPVNPKTDADLAEITRAVLEELRTANADADVRLEADAQVRGPWDPDRLEQVVSNLVGNAIRHGSGPVHVRVKAADSDAILEVHNGGPPIREEDLPSLFEAFRRRTLKDKTTRGQGLGLGLYISRQIVVAHGGTIDLRSTAPDGTTFTVKMPRSMRRRSLIVQRAPMDDEIAVATGLAR